MAIRPTSRRALLLFAAAVLAFVSADVIVSASADAPSISTSAALTDVPAPVVPLPVATDVVTVFQSGALTTNLRDAALGAAKAVGAPAATARGFTGMLTRLRRGTKVLQQVRAAGWVIPMGVTSMPLAAIAGIFGRTIAAPISQGQIVLSATSAGMRGAKEGDIIEFRGQSGTVSLTIGLVAPDDSIGGTEIVMGLPEANRLGAGLDSSVVIWGESNRAALLQAIAARGMSTNPKIRVEHSWDPPSPDETLGLAQTKKLLGEFDFDLAHLTSSGWTAMSPQWRAKYLPGGRVSYPTGIRALCNTVVRADLRAALTEVVNSGLGGGIDAVNTNSAGGCGTGSVRLSRVNQAFFAVSRHSWGQPIDMNTVSNCEGCVPRFDCRIVRIFRKHGYAWGGNFLVPDGMHFEWAGGARNTMQYPSKYCPNLPATKVLRTAGVSPPSSSGAATTPGITARDTMFAQAGWQGE
jgi:hypothetical protein